MLYACVVIIGVGVGVGAGGRGGVVLGGGGVSGGMDDNYIWISIIPIMNIHNE